MEDAPLSPTGKVILGLLARESRSGYEIKSAVEHSTRFFWAASFGQIYPELKRLADEGLVSGSEAPVGGRKRTVYEITPAGREALRAWLRTGPELMELRHEGMLMAFFAYALPPSERAGRLRAWARIHRDKVDALRELESHFSEQAKASDSRYVVLRYGIESNQWAADWCEREAKALESEQRS